MSEKRGRGRPKETDTDTSAIIAQAALMRFATQGYEATSLREIAADAEVDVALVAYRFGGKVDLWKAIVSQAAIDLQSALEDARSAAIDQGAQAQLRHSMKAFVDYLLARPEVPRLLLRDVTIDNDRSQWLLDELSLPLHRYFNELAQSAAGNCPVAISHVPFRVANFIYSAASAVARRDRLAKLVEGIAGETDFANALEATLIDGALGCG